MSKYLRFMNSQEGVRQIFTREKIGKMTGAEFEKYEKRIHNQLITIGIPSNRDLATVNNGKAYIWHTANDSKVCEKCKKLEGMVFAKIQNIPDDMHPNCRCYIEKIDLNYC